MGQSCRITNRLLVALSTLLICLCASLAPGVSAFSDVNGSALASSRISNPASRITGTYTALNRLELLIDRSPTNSIINCWRYRATPAGQRTWVEEFDKRTAWYRYDSLGRLQSETVTGSIKDEKNGVVTYGYDNVGNCLSRVSSLSGVTNQSFGYDWNDRLNGDQYDSNGNTKSAPVSQPSALNSQQLLGTDSYDSENRLTQRTGTNGSNVNIIYDGDGNRVQEIVNPDQSGAGGQIKNYLVDDRNPTGYTQVVEEIDNGSVNHTYTYGHDLISQDQLNTAGTAWKASFYCYDGRGTVRFLTDETGAVTDTYVYDAFGTLIAATGSTNNRYLYTGEQFDPNLGLYYLRARLMNPLTGRFWSMDAYEGNGGEPLSLHKYLYANTDPANRADPSGHFSLTDASTVGAIIGITAALTTPSYVNAPGPGDRVYGYDPGVDLMINIVGGQLLGRYVIGPAFEAVGQMVNYSISRAGRYVFPRVGTPATGAAGEVVGQSARLSFDSGIFAPELTTGTTLVYRAEGETSGNFGWWFGTQKPLSSLDAEELSNIFKHGNSAMRVATYEIPPNTQIYRGRTAGGVGEQIYIIDPKAKGLKLIKEEPLSFR